jgi:hypothetical protein
MPHLNHLPMTKRTVVVMKIPNNARIARMLKIAGIGATDPGGRI